MDNFIVSARKYRPQNFSTVVGQSHITTTLKNAILNNQLAHAYLFCGPRGVGKTTCARILAKTINCENRQADGEACNTCTSCVSFNNGSSFNIHELDAASNNSVDNIRELTDQVRFAPQAGRYKVYIIDEVHMLSASAFNAFLKTLEEPPSYAIFILATTEKHRILPTILSRCQIFDFKRITDADTVEHLEEIAHKEGIAAQKPALQVIAQKSEGCLRDSLSMLDKIVSFTGGELTYQNTLEHLNILDEDYYFRLLENMRKEDLAGSFVLFDEINGKGFDGEMLLNHMTGFFRNLMVCQDSRTLPLLEVVESFRPRYAEAAKKTTMPWLIGAVNILTEAEIGYRQARNKRLHIELALVKLTYLGQALEWVDEGSGPVKKKRIDALKPVAFRQIPPSPVRDPAAKSAPPPPAPQQIKTAQPEKNAEIVKPSATPSPSPHAPSEADMGIGETARQKQGQTAVQTGLGALQRIRQQMQARHREEGRSLALTDSALTEAWEKYVTRLVEEGDHTTASNLKAAELTITGETTFDIITDSVIRQRFVEQERGSLVDHLHRFFGNRSITYQVVLKEPEADGEEAPRPLTKREQFERMVQEYPLVKALKDSLKLDLE
jgi:DNA polymerase-3 subunit gamma/tau